MLESMGIVIINRYICNTQICVYIYNINAFILTNNMVCGFVWKVWMSITYWHLKLLFFLFDGVSFLYTEMILKWYEMWGIGSRHRRMGCTMDINIYYNQQTNMNSVLPGHQCYKILKVLDVWNAAAAAAGWRYWIRMCSSGSDTVIR